jgi:hypothetical protein
VNYAAQKSKTADFEELGYQTMLECGDEGRAKRICALDLHAYVDALQPEITEMNAEIAENRIHGVALHAHLYDRPGRVNDASMLTHTRRVRMIVTLAILSAAACLAGNMTTFYLMGWNWLPIIFSAAAMTALPLVVGHLAYERLVADHKQLQAAVLVAVVLLCFIGLYRLADARRMMLDKTAATPATTSYVEGVEDNTINPEPKGQETSELNVRGTLGSAMFMLTIAAEIMLGFLMGLLTRMRTHEDYAAWQKLKEISEQVIALETRIAELLASIEIAQKRCMAGILRAQTTFSRRRPPYHRTLAVFIFPLLFLPGRTASAQTIEHYEGVLIDVSGSIQKAGTTNDLFREYLVSTKKLLLTEPPNSRVWVSTISSESFGGVREVVKGWTPDARGVFTDDLERARRQLALSFMQKSSGMSPVAAGTDIFGGLWHLKALFESGTKPGSQGTSKTIWIFSDMMHETVEFPMPGLLAMGPEQMLERAKTSGLMVPLNGYKIHVYGASPAGLTPQLWTAIKSFWTAYFAAVGAELVSYSAECDTQR